MERRILILIIGLACTALQAGAQNDDFGLWGEVNVEKKLSKQWTVGAAAEYRSRDDASETDRWSFGADATYKVNDWLKASAGYTLLIDNIYKLNENATKYADYWGLRHRFNLSLTASKSFGNLGISLRERWQYTYRPERTVMRHNVVTGDEVGEKTYDANAKNVWRNRLQLKYKLTKEWRPYVNAESFVAGSGLEKIRYSAGTEYRLNKQHSFDVKYLYQHVYKGSDDETNRHIIGIGYTYSF